MNPPSSATSADSAEAFPGLGDLDDFNGFQFAQAETPPSAVAGAPLVSAAAMQAPDPVEAAARAADQRRTLAGRTLEQMVWQAPDGTRRHLRLTSGRWAQYESLLPLLRGRPDPAAGISTEALMEEELRAARAERYLTAGLLLYLCANDWEDWYQERTGKPALINDWPAMLLDARRWMDEFIHPSQLDLAVQTAEELARLTFSALTVARPGDDDSGDEEEPQKKTPPGTGRTAT